MRVDNIHEPQGPTQFDSITLLRSRNVEEEEEEEAPGKATTDDEDDHTQKEKKQVKVTQLRMSRAPTTPPTSNQD